MMTGRGIIISYNFQCISWWESNLVRRYHRCRNAADSGDVNDALAEYSNLRQTGAVVAMSFKLNGILYADIATSGFSTILLSHMPRSYLT